MEERFECYIKERNIKDCKSIFMPLIVTRCKYVPIRAAAESIPPTVTISDMKILSGQLIAIQYAVLEIFGVHAFSLVESSIWR